MKNLTPPQIGLEAKRLKGLWICHYGERTADTLSLAMRRLFKTDKKKGEVKKDE